MIKSAIIYVLTISKRAIKKVCGIPDYSQYDLLNDDKWHTEDGITWTKRSPKWKR